jgi:SAM-dependent methyltransferase
MVDASCLAMDERDHEASSGKRLGGSIENDMQRRRNPAQTRFIPALRFNALTSLYDPLLHWTLRESTFKRQLVRQVALQPEHRALDLGCGTATLTLLLKQSQPQAKVIGLDGDPHALRIARAKARAAAMDVAFDEGLTSALPYEAGDFDRVVSSLVFHHLSHEDKLRTLREALRVLRPGGQLHVADWGKAANVIMRAAFFGVQLLDGFATTTENVQGALPTLFASAGFIDVQQTAHFATVFGSLALYRANKPANHV